MVPITNTGVNQIKFPSAVYSPPIKIEATFTTIIGGYWLQHALLFVRIPMRQVEIKSIDIARLNKKRPVFKFF